MKKIVFLIAWVMIIGITTSVEAKDLKIGLALPITGPYAFAGKIVVNATKLAAEDMGGKVNIGGESYTLKFVEYDTKYSAEGGRAAAERLIFEDKVKFIIGGFSADTQGFQSLVEKNKIINLHLSSSIYASPDKPYSFRSTMIVDAKYKALYEAVKKMEPDLKTIAFINPDNPLGEMYSKFAGEGAKPLGYETVASELVKSASSDYSPVLTKILAKKPDIIDLGATGGSADSALIIKQARELGFKGRFIAAVGLQSKTVSEVAGIEAMEGVIETGFHPEDPELSDSFKKLGSTWVKRFPKLPFVDLVSEVYDVTKNLFIFLDGQDTMDTEVLKDRFADYVWNGIYGECYWAGEKDYGIKRLKAQPVYFSQWRKGVPVIFTKAPADIP